MNTAKIHQTMHRRIAGYVRGILQSRSRSEIRSDEVVAGFQIHRGLTRGYVAACVRSFLRQPHPELEIRKLRRGVYAIANRKSP